MNLCIIPARGGSKRIERKNIKKFFGKPMIYYAINAAKNSKLFDKIIVSTDDEEIANISLNCGVDVPFIRPKELANDFADTVDVISHAIKNLDSENRIYKYVCCIYPCVPFIKIGDLKDALQLLKKTNSAEYSFPVTEFQSAIQRAMKIKKSFLLESFFPEYEQMRTQDLVKSYYDAGQFYWAEPNSWNTNNNIHNSGVGLIIPNSRVVDIDTKQDWERAEILYKTFGNEI